HTDVAAVEDVHPEDAGHRQQETHYDKHALCLCICTHPAPPAASPLKGHHLRPGKAGSAMVWPAAPRRSGHREGIWKLIYLSTNFRCD
ncbi:hypothetical protein, partial [Hydrogenophaga sp.]|uniref:hypothetical protein n=1 Tax=Hydrogenophaga sp. TaxID=1904254 RepID=UPI00286EAD36